MRNVFAGLVFATICSSVALAQNAPNTTAGTQPGAAGQKQGEPAGQGQTIQGQTIQGQAVPGQQLTQSQAVPGQAIPGQAGQAQAVQPGRVGAGQPIQPGQPAQLRQQTQLTQAGHQGHSGTADQQIAACVYGECHNEIEIAKLAESKAQNQEVRDFAQRMVRDHSPGCQEMQRLAGDLVADHGQTHSGAAANRSESASRGESGNLDWVSIKKQIGQQCLASTKQELSSKSSHEFDECFMGQQIAGHMKVIDELKVLRNYASSDLQQKLDKELQTAQQHLQLAKQIEQKLKDHPSERVSRKSEGNK
jgi:predicted outer membrane protein